MVPGEEEEEVEDDDDEEEEEEDKAEAPSGKANAGRIRICIT